MTPEKAEGRPRQGDPHDTTSPTATLPSAADVAALLALSDERDRELVLRLYTWRLGYAHGYALGAQDGRLAEVTERDQAWNSLARRVLSIAMPDGPEARESAARRLRAAEAGTRRDAAEHWRARWAELYRLSKDERFCREAAARDPFHRDYAQTVALILRAKRLAGAA